MSTAGMAQGVTKATAGASGFWSVLVALLILLPDSGYLARPNQACSNFQKALRKEGCTRY